MLTETKSAVHTAYVSFRIGPVDRALQGVEGCNSRETIR